MDRDRGTTVDRNLGSRHPTLAVCDANECRKTEPHVITAGYWMKVSCLECFVKSGSHRSHDARLEFGYVSRVRRQATIGKGDGWSRSRSSHLELQQPWERWSRRKGAISEDEWATDWATGPWGGHAMGSGGRGRLASPPRLTSSLQAGQRVPQKFAPVASSDHLTPSPPRRDAGMTPRPDHGRSQNHSQWLASAVSASCQIFRISGAFPAAELQSERPGDGLRRSPSLPDAGLRNRRGGRSVTKYTRPGGGASHPHFSRPPFLTDEGNEATAARFGDKRGLVRASRMAPCRRRTEAARKPCRRAILRCATALPPREHE
ncbi:hypothetical protein PCL_09264 [Purpureocillium lilacinum]|uniref:Uncharacterized protein n=1 Tax=Purpureocillium lilacinum TaxID=33203 RepID=A0A2U3EHK5_PURLI|nr:hypothetical protein PCL_09264 [Purpureocillium lilacinum]